MTRREAVGIIQNVLDNPYDYPALTILMKLEDAGMLPPGRKIKEKRVGPCWEVEVDTIINEWEE